MKRIKIYRKDGIIQKVQSTIDAQDVRVEVIDIDSDDENAAQNLSEEDELPDHENNVVRRMSDPADLRKKIMEVLRTVDELREVPGAECFELDYYPAQGDLISDDEVDGICHVDDPYGEFCGCVDGKYAEDEYDLITYIMHKVRPLSDDYEMLSRMVRGMIVFNFPDAHFMRQYVNMDIILKNDEPWKREYMNTVILARMTIGDILKFLYADVPVRIRSGAYASETDLHIGPGFPEPLTDDLTITGEQVQSLIPDSCLTPYNFSGTDPACWKDGVIDIPEVV